MESSPAIGSDGTIYIGSADDNLYAINTCTGGLADTPWPMFHHDERHTGSLAPLINTPTGDDVAVSPIDQTTGTSPVTVTFEHVTEAGLTSLSTSADGPSLPTGFKLGEPPVYYDLTTTAGYSGQIEVCIDYSGVSFVNEEDLQLFHYDESSDTWIDVTSSLDTDNNIICGIVDSLSFFAILELEKMEVQIDIRPFSRRNIIFVWKHSLISVAILSSGDFYAPSEVDRRSLTFGRTGNEESLAFCLRHAIDVNRDGLRDLICFFWGGLTGFQVGDTEGILKGQTVNGVPIEGRDSVIVRGRWIWFFKYKY